jgi:2-hydroxychromene-2-carboxylate isomerase
MPPFEFWFDFGSTYSYVAAERLGPLAARAGVDVRWRPFLLGPIFTSQLGIQDSPFNVQPVRGRYMWRDLERLCARSGIPWKKPSAFPRNGLLAARVSCLAPDAPWVPAFCRAVFRANFAEDRDISTPALVEALLREGGQDGAALVAAAGAPEAKQALRERGDAAARAGIFGAPNFLVGDELFFGQDRLQDALDWVTR